MPSLEVTKIPPGHAVDVWVPVDSVVVVVVSMQVIPVIAAGEASSMEFPTGVSIIKTLEEASLGAGGGGSIVLFQCYLGLLNSRQ